MESQRLFTILLILTALVGYGWSQFGNVPLLPSTGISDRMYIIISLYLFLGVRLFLGEEDMAIANFSMISAASFHDVNTNITDGQNDGLWCQSSLNENTIGTWYYPDGTEVPRVDTFPLYSNNTPTGQIGLLRKGPIASIQGLYRCVIPNEEQVSQTLYVAAYGTGDFSTRKLSELV